MKMTPLEKLFTEALKNELDSIRERAKLFRMTSDHIYGKDVIILNKDKITGEYKTERHELESIFMQYFLNKNTKINKVIAQVEEDILNHEKKVLNSFNGKPFTCYQLSDWVWLEDEDGKIFHEKHIDGEHYYVATLVKCAKYLED